MSGAPRERAWAFITRPDRRLLVFDEPDHPEAGTQVPGGRFDDGETPEAAVLREAREETGFTALVIVRTLGVLELAWGSYTSPIHAFHLVFAEPVPERWEHGEFTNDEPIAFAFRWVTLDEAERALWGSQARFLPALARALD